MDDFSEPSNPEPKPWLENPYYVLPASFVGLILLLAVFYFTARSTPASPAPAAGGSPVDATAVFTTVTATVTPSATATIAASPTASPSPFATATTAPTETAVRPTSTTKPLPTATAVPSKTPTAVPPTAVPPTATAIPRPIGGFPALALDAWELPGQEFCQGSQGYRAIFMEGHGGDGLYSYYWNDEPVSEPLYQQSFTYQAPVGGGSSQGQVKVVSGDGKIAIVILFVKGLECPN
ncbi:MAG: hypothetical protein H6659_08600 [Ardenticatenaceae bacterium]|nr:hypothetical protein [Ardenticatenaceae bacterium]